VRKFLRVFFVAVVALAAMEVVSVGGATDCHADIKPITR
jgi:hypothetical protein